MSPTQKYQQTEVLYKSAAALKDSARRSSKSTKEYLEAYEAYSKAATFITTSILTDPSFNNSEIVQASALKHYYLYESFDCLYNFESQQRHFDSALQAAINAELNIREALRVILNQKKDTDPKTQEFLTRMEKDWKSIEILAPAKKIEPLAKKAIDEKNFIEAFDRYKQMLPVVKAGYEYKEKEQFEPIHLRITKGNYLAVVAMISQLLAFIQSEQIENNSFDFDTSGDLLSHFLNSLELISTAFDENPEWTQYREGAEATRKNIKLLLSQNKDKWFKYLTEFKTNTNLHTLMQQTDNTHYKNEMAKIELENNKFKVFLLTGMFWLILAGLLAWWLISAAESSISWYRFLAIIFFFPVIYTIVGAFVLRSTNVLKEENFIKLISLAFRVELKGR